ncbi:LytR/AlgR family response regulator transcription factor [Undibacterium fentianense]|uniref:Response regulator transcription factor n=1 Tax=Undibacterium fentianense TaxID=2828728 RepID=A0A941IDF9_9BURK|nr:LytTR family DNA-binding domain-containing protein [Undibacterium fentianense]MBR7798511.1 response regulator transcription factor [Undibacterium fentianense]
MPKCVVAEDESLLREALLEQLGKAWPNLEIIAACDDGASALEAIIEGQPDVAFLDIRMPGLTGIEIAEAMKEHSPHTQIVFVTAYDQYAIDAFNKGAVDYLLKPVSYDRLSETVQRLQSRAVKDLNAVASLLQQLNIGNSRGLATAFQATQKNEPLVWLTASSGTETKLIMVDDVAYFKADNKYTVVMTAEGESLLRKPIRELLELLDATIFKQIHRSTIVNLKAIASIARDDTGKGIVKLKTRPETLTVSQPFMVLFRNM